MKGFQYLTVVGLAVLGLSSAVIAQDDVPVMITPIEDMDACGLYGEVVNINTFLAVRSGPGAEFQKLDELANGDAVYICDDSIDGWYGVVYPLLSDSCDDVTSPAIVDKPYEYDGICMSGWVSEKFIGNLAG